MLRKNKNEKTLRQWIKLYGLNQQIMFINKYVVQDSLLLK